MIKRKHKQHHEEHMDETWLIPYADLLTLLLALFIVLFASSQIDAKKLGDMRQVFSAIFTGNTGVLSQESAISGTMPNENTPQQSSQDTGKTLDVHTETSQLLNLKENIDKYVQQNNLGPHLSTSFDEEGLHITIGEIALFPSGSAEVLPDARKIANEIAKMLVSFPQKVTVAGHTDNEPINTRDYPSNWDLSTKRSLNFMKLMLENKQLNPAKYNATGYGEFRPAASNLTPEGRQQNRRVEVVIQRIYK